jgi:membrane protein implicated in regulation of membrane protease activity
VGWAGGSRSPGPITERTGQEASDLGDQTMVGKLGRVTGTVAAGRLGEVMVQVRGGSEAFHAYAAEGEETLVPGTRIVVVEYYPPRTVVVSRM